MWSVPSRRKDASTEARMTSGRESGTRGLFTAVLPMSKWMPNLVAMTTRSRRGRRAETFKSQYSVLK